MTADGTGREGTVPGYGVPGGRAVTVATVAEGASSVPIAEQLAMLNQSAWPTYSAQVALGIPGVGKALALYKGLIGAMPLDAHRGIAPLPRPRLLARPDPTRPRSWFVGQQVEDYLVHGNAVQYVTAWNAEAKPAAVVWLPATRVGIQATDTSALAVPEYYLDGRKLDRGNVIHVQRGADPWFPWRGVGVLEQHVQSLSRVYTEEAYEAGSLSLSGVPSVAVITPNRTLSDTEIDQAREKWMEVYGGPVRTPGIFPHGTEVKPLAWSPNDAQLNQARQASLNDIANIFNLDGYWLGAPTAPLTYKSPGPMFTTLVRTTLSPVCQVIEDEWGFQWLPTTQTLRFDRAAAESDTMAATAEWVRQTVAVTGADGQVLMTTDEGRAAMHLAVQSTSLGASVPSPLPTQGDSE